MHPSQKRVLYLGSDLTHYQKGKEGIWIHYPILKIVPRPIDEMRFVFDDLDEYTHLIFSSKHGVHVFFDCLKQLNKKISHQTILAVGKVTGQALLLHGYHSLVAQKESQEGLIALLKQIDLKDAYVFMPRSSLSRFALSHFLMERGVRHQLCDLYDTLIQRISPLPNIEEIDEIVFTSPSTVRGFLQLFGKLPQDKMLTALGAVTKEELMHHCKIHSV